MRGRVIGALGLVAVAAGCSLGGTERPDRASTPPLSSGVVHVMPQRGQSPLATTAEERAMIDDWYDNGEVDVQHRCLAIRAAMEQLASVTDGSTGTAVDALGSIQRAFCSAKVGGASVIPFRPTWVTKGVEHIRGRFLGHPAPAGVTWGDSQRTRWVSVDFGEPHVCSGCSHPSSVGPIRLTGATVHFAPHGTRVTTFTGRKD